MRLVGVLLLACACGAKPDPRATSPADQPVANQLAPKRIRGSAGPEGLIARERPELDMSWAVPDFTAELRWPLTGMTHPTLEPRFPVTQELAIGVEWQDLCARGLHTRVSATQKEVLTYLAGWCHVQKRDVDGACARLTTLLGSVKKGMRLAVRHDIANILVEHGNAEKAEHWLSKHHIRDVATLDLLAANYIELGSPIDAFEINRRAMDADDRASDETKCMRLAKRIVIGLDHEPEVHAIALRKVAALAKVSDPTCERVWNKVACWLDRNMCTHYFIDQGFSPQMQLLHDAYEGWPEGEVTWAAWWTYADKARLALGAPGASALVVTAMDTAVDTAPGCREGMAISFHNIAADVRRAPDGSPFEDRLREIERACTLPRLPPGSSTGSASSPPASQAPGVKPPPAPRLVP